MKNIWNIFCLVLIFALLCPTLISCSNEHPPVSATQTADQQQGENQTDIKYAYPCEVDPDFTTESPMYQIPTAELMASLPIANSDMTAMEKRKLCLDFFQLTLSFLWETDMDVTDYHTSYVAQFGDRALFTGNYYAGIPYQSGGVGNLYRILEYYDAEKGVLSLSRAFAENGGYGKDADFEYVKNVRRYKAMTVMFNACSSSANWAWGRVINSADFGSTSDYNVSSGLIPVGCYTYKNMETVDRFGQVTENNPDKMDTPDVIAEIGTEKLYDCYALLRPADCLVSDGHTLMVKKVNLVLSADGTPDPKKSKVVVLDQYEKWSLRTELNGKKLFRQGNVDRSLSFESLMKSNYLPFTFVEFLDASDPFDQPHLEFYNTYIAPRNYLASKYQETNYTEEDLDRMAGTSVEKGEVFLTGNPKTIADLENCAVGSNYTVSDVFVCVKSADGKTVVKNVYRSTSSSTRTALLSSEAINLPRDADGKYPSLMTGVAEAIEAGGKLEISLQISTGELLQIKGLDF